MKSEQWRPLLGFVFVSVLCAVLMTVSATRGFGLDLFRPGRPIAAPRVVEPLAARPTPAVRAPIMVPAELSAVRPTAGVPARSTRPQASRSSRSSWSAGRAVDTPGTRGLGAPVPTPTPTPTTVPVVPTTVPTTRPDKDAEKAQREAEREAEKSQREAEREAEKAQREAEREAEKAQREAEKAQRDAEREAEKAQRDAEREAEKAQREAERQPVQTTSDRTAS